MERETDIDATDDYFFEEAWRQEARELSFQVIPSSLAKQGPSQFFRLGSSTNDEKFRGSVVQHQSPIPQMRQAEKVKCLVKRHAPEPVLKVARKAKSIMGHGKAQIAAAGSGSFTVKDFNILLKRAAAYCDINLDTWGTTASRVKDASAAQRSLSWGRAFQEYRQAGSVNAMPVPPTVVGHSGSRKFWGLAFALCGWESQRTTYSLRQVRSRQCSAALHWRKSCVIGCLTAIYDTEKLGKVYMPDIASAPVRFRPTRSPP
ncbi:hypothetical protein [Pelagibacterium lentulum]|uniref:hypothetical protein n=1 Tax=Pelagibacterium lentulum TaxID=2029865 RepID=UPI001666116F|nr:hypothetical protein [Pelagibacterium lentulum]